MHDVIVIGARVAGASTAMVLARRGFKVLCLDRATFPSDTLSTHQIQLPGIAKLKRWGLLEAVIAAKTPPTREVILDTGNVVLKGCFPAFDGIDALYGPRRTVLDKILVDAARASGVDLREDVVVDGLLSSGQAVTGVRGRTANGQVVHESARLVVGADGKDSAVAKLVGAPAYSEVPPRSAAFYAYWEGLPPHHGELYERPGRVVGVWPTNGGLTVTYIGLPIADHGEFRRDLVGSVMAALDLAGDLGERVRSGRRVGPILGSANLPNRFRKPFGPGWALVGDAGLVMDPISGQGIGHAFRDADLLADAIEAGLGGSRNIERAMRSYETERNRQSRGMYRMTTQQAAMGPRSHELETLYRCLQGNPREIDMLFGLLAGTVSFEKYMSPIHLLRVLGSSGIASITLQKLVGGWSRRSRTAVAPPCSRGAAA
jgi:2-polyprenyl-6-methoxyphenol hydroxylase-like FAD-dependent oxidoreductase